jgi:superfamily II DNA or RNA helicase
MDVHVDYDKARKKGVLITDFLPNIREYFSVEDKQQAFKKRFAVGYRPQTRMYAITPQGRFEPRLLNEIINYLKSVTGTGRTFNITLSDIYKESTAIPELQQNIQRLNIPLRDYQEEAVTECLKRKSGIVLLPTSAGKTLVISTLCKSMQGQFKMPLKTLILVPDIQLVQQTYSDFIEYGIEESTISRWTGSHEPDFTKDIIIANSQILLSKKQDISSLMQIRVLIIDEVHKCKASNSINKVVRNIPAVYKYGFTGTMPVDKIDCWNITGIIGEVIYSKKSIELRERNFISKVSIGVVFIHHKTLPVFTQASMSSPTVEYEEEINFLQNNVMRNNVISAIVKNVKKNILIMVDRINHGEILYTLLSNIEGRQVYFVQGSVDVSVRDEIRSIMESNDNVVCIAISKIFSTGVNIRNLHYVVFSSIGKAKNKIIQSIGRSLRLHASKSSAYIIDIADNLKYSNKHLQERLELYKEENIVYSVKDVYSP